MDKEVLFEYLTEEDSHLGDMPDGAWKETLIKMIQGWTTVDYEEAHDLWIEWIENTSGAGNR